MGIYVFKKDILLKLLKNTRDYDFGGQVIPGAAKDHKVQAYLFNDYWEDIGTIKTFFEANLALAEMVRPALRPLATPPLVSRAGRG
jgi:glucose-1-phosphate adenylyltransferase